MDRKISEHELLAALCRKNFSRSSGTDFYKNPDTDWDYLVRAARYHRVIPHLCRQPGSPSEPAVPPAVRKDLKRSFLQVIRFNLLATGELLSLCGKITAANIPVIPFKGPALSQLLYGDITGRQFDDLDILVHRKDVEAVQQILLSSGYRDDQELTPAQERHSLRSRHHHPFTHGTTGVHVEVHWKFSPRIYSFSPDLPAIWKRAGPLALSGREVLSLSDEDLFLILCDHGARHYWQRLSMVYDIAMFIGRDGMDWDYLLRTARETGSERVLLLGISLAETLFGTGPPADISSRCTGDRAVGILTQQAVERILCHTIDTPDLQGSPASPDVEEELFYLRARERFADRARYYFRRATTPEPEDRAYVRLPDPLFFLYPPVRVCRLLLKNGPGIWRWFGK